MGYWKDLAEAVRSAVGGIAVTGRHLREARRRRPPRSVADPRYFERGEGRVTVQYPREAIPVPDVGRYRLFVEIDDCIGCDQCMRVCPVDCITIEKVRAADDLGLTSDGTKVKFYLPTFDIDMAKCCFCGLCTVVCPTECITMTKVHDYAEYDRENFIYHFGNLTPPETHQKQEAWDAHEAEQKRLKEEALARAKAEKAAKAAAESNNPETSSPPAP